MSRIWDWIKAHKEISLGLVGALAALLFYLFFGRGKSSSTTSTTIAPPSMTGGLPGTGSPASTSGGSGSSSAVASLQGELQKMAGALQSSTQKVTSLQSQLAQTTSQDTARYTSVANELKAAQTALTNLQQNYKGVQGQLQAEQQKVAAAQQSASASAQAAAQAQAHTTSANNTITALKEKVSSLTHNVTSTVRRVTGNTSSNWVGGVAAPKSAPVSYKLEGKDYLNSSAWGLSKLYLQNHGNGGKGISNPTNAQIAAQLDTVKKLNPHITNWNAIPKNTMIKMA